MKMKLRVRAALTGALVLAGSLAGAGGAQAVSAEPANPTVASGDGTASPRWLGQGPIYQYPQEGGTWEYGFWNAQIRSYYTVGRCHTSAVQLNNDAIARSIRTQANARSLADTFAVNYWNNNDRYWYGIC